MKAELTDPFGRRVDYLRLSVTDRCDLRCVYCMPQGFDDYEAPADWLTFDEIERVVRIFGELGVSRIRMTGGEPLVRKGIVELSRRLSSLREIDDLSMSTNCVSMEKFAQPLKDAGISRINVSLDSLNPKKFQEITGGGKLSKVIAGLLASKAAGFTPIKINAVAMKGVNDDELGDMVEFCLKHDFTLRFIETMPIGDTGCRAKDSHYLDLEVIREELEQRFDLVPSVMPGAGPARYFRIKDTDMHFGFITPISQHFCETCNRLRLSTDGTLYMCLGQDDKYELRPLLRGGASDDEIKDAIHEALTLKPERHEFNEGKGQTVRFMNMTGG
ncbi:MAG: GTP 3',8-cyclase MoaA [Gammaproteobacteria bacterium]|uniref:GTP 3',8-cyclase n=1 Tax=Candidatus Thiopontia autotrophica TaxID=2841688 RepID=A0A8J6TW58_9GAMM|nr:GTP 3',8-cyclase MoaA [Candidatus Thiopontia autotrophica]MBL6968842.1 GTP 3',8-cyclase MoaA [Gammaproteobacteria bacterium]